MGFRFRRSIRILPGLRLNIGKRGVSASVGGRGAHITVGHGKVRETVGIPGTGLSYTATQGTHQAHQKGQGEAQEQPGSDVLPKGRAARGWLWVALLVVIVGAMAYEAAKATESPLVPDVYSIPHTKPDRRGTEQQPLVISRPSDERRREEFADSQHARNESQTTIATIVLAVFTVALWVANIWLILESRKVSTKQAQTTLMAIEEAKRSAVAMRDVADATKNNAVLMSSMLSKQMRAYIQINIGKSTAQREVGIGFGSWPEIVNVGLTPAKNVSYRVMADILDSTTPMHDFPEPKQVYTNDATLNPRQSFTITVAVNRRFDQTEVDEISRGETKRLFVWGTITYDDVFDGQNRETRFSHNFKFFDQADPDTGKIEHKVLSYYSNGHNDAT
jgi:hypothetical protein